MKNTLLVYKFLDKNLKYLSNLSQKHLIKWLFNTMIPIDYTSPLFETITFKNVFWVEQYVTETWTKTFLLDLPEQSLVLTNHVNSFELFSRNRKIIFFFARKQRIRLILNRKITLLINVTLVPLQQSAVPVARCETRPSSTWCSAGQHTVDTRSQVTYRRHFSPIIRPLRILSSIRIHVPMPRTQCDPRVNAR